MNQLWDQKDLVYFLCSYLNIIFINESIFRFKRWGNSDPHRSAADVAFAVARFFQSGGSLMNYYMVSVF